MAARMLDDGAIEAAVEAVNQVLATAARSYSTRFDARELVEAAAPHITAAARDEVRRLRATVAELVDSRAAAMEARDDAQEAADSWREIAQKLAAEREGAVRRSRSAAAVRPPTSPLAIE